MSQSVRNGPNPAQVRTTCKAGALRAQVFVRSSHSSTRSVTFVIAMDGVFVDGGYTDTLSLALNVGQYHETGGDLDKVLKIVLTNTNEFTVETQGHPILAYFSNPDNQNVEPGAYLWSPESLPGPSYQIFQESLTYERLIELSQPIVGSNLSTALLKATTINNDAYGVLSGQAVEILLIDLNAAIPTVILGQDSAKEYTEPLADMAVHIASSDELRSRVESFAAPVDEPVSSAYGNRMSALLLASAVSWGSGVLTCF